MGSTKLASSDPRTMILRCFIWTVNPCWRSASGASPGLSPGVGEGSCGRSSQGGLFYLPAPSQGCFSLFIRGISKRPCSFFFCPGPMFFFYKQGSALVQVLGKAYDRFLCYSVGRRSSDYFRHQRASFSGQRRKTSCIIKRTQEGYYYLQGLSLGSSGGAPALQKPNRGGRRRPP